MPACCRRLQLYTARLALTARTGAVPVVNPYIYHLLPRSLLLLMLCACTPRLPALLVRRLPLATGQLHMLAGLRVHDLQLAAHQRLPVQAERPAWPPPHVRFFVATQARCKAQLFASVQYGQVPGKEVAASRRVS